MSWLNYVFVVSTQTNKTSMHLRAANAMHAQADLSFFFLVAQTTLLEYSFSGSIMCCCINTNK